MIEENNYCTFYLVRHGEAEGNARGLSQGHSDFPLTEKGRIQASNLGASLKNVHFDAAYSSDLVRAKETAEIVVAEQKLAVLTSDLIRERWYGSFESKPAHEYDTKIAEAELQLEALTEMRGKTTGHDLIGVENNEKLIGRTLTFLREVAVTHSSKIVLIVAHGGLLRALLGHIAPETFGNLKRGAISNAGFVKILSDGTDFIIKETVGVKLPTK